MLSNRTLRKLRFCGSVLLRVLRLELSRYLCHVSRLRYLRPESMLVPQLSKYLIIIIYSAKYAIIGSLANLGQGQWSRVLSPPDLRPRPLIAQRRPLG